MGGCTGLLVVVAAFVGATFWWEHYRTDNPVKDFFNVAEDVLDGLSGREPARCPICGHHFSMPKYNPTARQLRLVRCPECGQSLPAASFSGK